MGVPSPSFTPAKGKISAAFIQDGGKINLLLVIAGKEVTNECCFREDQAC